MDIKGKITSLVIFGFVLYFLLNIFPTYIQPTIVSSFGEFGNTLSQFIFFNLVVVLFIITAESWGGILKKIGNFAKGALIVGNIVLFLTNVSIKLNELIPDPPQETKEFLSKTFGLPTFLLSGSSIVFNLFLPFLSIAYFVYYLLDKLGIFTRSSISRFILGLTIGAMWVYAGIFSLFITKLVFSISMTGIIYFKVRSVFWKIIYCILALYLIVFYLP